MILMKRCNNKAYKHCFVSRFKCIHFVGKSFSLSSSLFTRKFVAIWKPFSETLTAEKPRSTAAFLPVQQLIDNTILYWCALFRFFHVSTQCLKITLNWHANFNFFAKIHFGDISMTRNIFNWNFAKKPEIERISEEQHFQCRSLLIFVLRAYLFTLLYLLARQNISYLY